MDLMEIKVKCSEIIPDIDMQNFNKHDIHKHIDSGLHSDTLIELEDKDPLK